MKNEKENFNITSETPSPSNSELVLFEENLIRDISLLNKNFDLSSMPSNYMRKRSKIEEIIYQAVFNQNNHKSPFASFKIANDCLPDLPKIDIVTGTNNLKKVIKSLYSNSEQISIMVHKIGNTWLMDDFDLDALFLGNQHYADWNWLRDFIARDGLQLAKADLSRASLTMRDLYAKFLYHSVNQLSIQLPEKDSGDCSQLDNVSKLPLSKQGSHHKLRSNYPSTDHRYDHHREDFIHLVDWKLNDLSFVVGSDLSIFGTKSHPCISLRLHPSQEPINILTGIDMWLENLLNEVPEVAMCYHDQGIVMREYEIFRTDDIPHITGFDKDEVESIAKNLSHFLSTNATKEGHTYWLFKEVDSTMVKLYDLTDIWMKNQQTGNSSSGTSGRHAADSNPFILPVAVLCYKMAENRIKQWHRARNKRGKSNLTSSQFNNELLENKLADDLYYFNDIFRLLKNCINLLIRTDKNQDLVNKAIILMCQLYLEVDQTTIKNLHYQTEAQSKDFVRFDLNDLKGIDKVNNTPSMATSNITSELLDDNNLIGTQLYQLCVKNSAEELFVRTLSILDTYDIAKNDFNFTEEELHLRKTLLADSPISTMVKKKTLVKDDLFESVLNFHEIHCLGSDIADRNGDDLKAVLKSGFLVALFDGDIWSETEMTLARNVIVYSNLITAFIRWHVDLQATEDCTLFASGNTLNKMDTKMITYYCDKKQSLKYIDVISLFQAVFMPENKRISRPVDDRIHRSWYDVIKFLVRLSDELLNVSLVKSSRISVQRGIPVLVNFLVAAIANIYKQQSKKCDSDNDKVPLEQWCKDSIFPVIDWIVRWTEMADFSINIEDTFLALLWTNKAKLYRLCAAINDQCDYLYRAIDSYSKAIETFVYVNKKKIPAMYLGLKSDRLDLCMQLLEGAYNWPKKTPDRNTDDTKTKKNEEMSRALELSDRIYRNEVAYQNYGFIGRRLMSLRLRMNYVRYYLNLTSHAPLNYDQILNDFKSDMRLIMTDENSVSKCKESLLIMFYLCKIESDRLEILSVTSLESFLRENTKILSDILGVKSYRSYLEKEGQNKLKEIYGIIVNILKRLLSKCYSDCHRKRKVQRDRKVIEELENYLDKKSPDRTILEEFEDLLKEIKNFI